MISIILFLSFLGVTDSISWAAQSAGLPGEISPDLMCHKSTSKFLSGMKPSVQREWFESPGNSSTKVFRSPSNEIGTWYEVQWMTDSNSLQIVSYSPKAREIYRFSEPSCIPEKTSISPWEFYKQTKGSKTVRFDDRVLEGLLKKFSAGIIYVWSPRMVYSVKEAEKVSSVARQNGFEMISVLSHLVSDEEVKSALKVAKIESAATRKLASVDLFMRGGTLHYPSIFVFANGKIHPHRIIGVMTDHDLGYLMKKYRSELK